MTNTPASPPKGKRTVVLLSGGQDSSTCLALAARDAQPVGAIFVRYGQHHAIEEEAARYFAERYGLPLKLVNVPALTELGNSTLVGEDEGPVSHPEGVASSFVPGRNLIFLTLASAYAMGLGATQVWTGVCETDYSGYPDCRRNTMDALEQSIRFGMDFPELEIVTPLMYLDKAQTFALADELGVLEEILERSHTCYHGDRTHRHEWGYGCGQCPACELRAGGWERFKTSLR